MISINNFSSFDPNLVEEIAFNLQLNGDVRLNLSGTAIKQYNSQNQNWQNFKNAYQQEYSSISGDEGETNTKLKGNVLIITPRR